MSISNLTTALNKPYQVLNVEKVNTASGGAIADYHFITRLEDFPAPIGGIIYLEPTAYMIAAHVDLDGNRLVTTGTTSIAGTSSETSSLTSTGLGAGVPLITSDYTLSLMWIDIRDVGTAIAIDGNTNIVALDWTGVNFTNIPTIGTINTCANFIYTKGALLGSQGLVFDGTHGTIGINGSLLQGSGAAGSIMQITPTAIITRRLRVIYSSFVAFGSTTALDVSVSATIANEQYILDSVTFSGGATYLSGVTSSDNKALFIRCVGIQNSGDISQIYMYGNVTPTPIAVTSTPVKVLGTTTSAAVTQKFTNTNNRATYVGALTKYFNVRAVLSMLSGNNNQIGIYIARNGTVLPESEIYVTTNGAGRAEAACVQTLVYLTSGDYIEIWVENQTATNAITVTELNTIIS